MGHPLELSLCPPSRTLAPTVDVRHPGCYGSAVHGLKTQRREEKQQQGFFEKLGKGRSGSDSAAHLVEPGWESGLAIGDGPLRAMQERIPPLICFVQRGRLKKPQTPPSPAFGEAGGYFRQNCYPLTSNYHLVQAINYKSAS